MLLGDMRPLSSDTDRGNDRAKPPFNWKGRRKIQNGHPVQAAIYFNEMSISSGHMGQYNHETRMFSNASSDKIQVASYRSLTTKSSDKF